jgi:Protein ChrB, N-terminal
MIEAFLIAETMPTSEVTIACGALVGRKPDAFSDRASRCGDAGSINVRSIRVKGSDHDALVAEQRTERDEDYREVVERVPAFLAEITMETARGRTTYAEVEESEADLERFEKWLAAITARDYFHAPAGVAARIAVQQCRDALAGFEAAALAAEFDEGQSERHRNSAAGLTVVEDAP